jgi:small subunit ribosomal protein S20
MAHTASAKKRLRQSEKRHAQNKAVKSRLATLRRRFVDALEAGDLAKAQQELTTVQKAFDQAGAKHTVHKKTAGRKVSRLYKMLETAKAGTGEAAK